MHALIAIDSFKNSMTSLVANQTVADQLAKYRITTSQVAIADGGEGTVAAFLANHPGGQALTVATVDLAQRPIQATYGYFEAEHLAVIEVAAASGIQFLTAGLNPSNTNTYGTGLVIKAAVAHGATRVILGLGGSGTVDGGAGILRALGVRFLDQRGQSLSMVGADLAQVAAIDTQQLLPALRNVNFVSAADVTNPLTGQLGATRVFGLQKGLSTERMAAYDHAMAHYMQVATGAVSDHQADGAAGGIGFALRYFLHATVRSGFDLIAELSDLERLVHQADFVISGEGQVDDQSFMGKVPIKISHLAQAAGKNCYLLVGSQRGSAAAFATQGVTAVLPIVDRVMTLDEALTTGPVNLARTAERLGQLVTHPV
ncbi:glycerate kinase family protein [Lactiplantibacillus carotarum]|uniref:glycerate kinase family protein n=1 Tax=Lactiplantibacillus carotarum TaxID=2993456 RepID=UPI00298F2EF7|nr:glycerate kinase [Lactiplantibacillus carotarum]